MIGVFQFRFNSLIAVFPLVCFCVTVVVGTMSICFHLNELNERGTPAFVYDYAHYNEAILGYKSKFIVPFYSKTRYGISRSRFEKRFGNLTFYMATKTFGLTAAALSLTCDVLYIEKSGTTQSSPGFYKQFSCVGPPTAIHAGFNFQYHGDAYAMLSEEQVKPDVLRHIVKNASEEDLERYSQMYVPLIVASPPLPPYKVLLQNQVKSVNSSGGITYQIHDLRAQYAIPSSALVICRHGGYKTFSESSVHEAVCESSAKYNASQLFYLFLGTQKWENCTANPSFSNMQFLSTTVDVSLKEAFFGACDVMLHARPGGEVFSTAIAEASVRNLPVLHKIMPGSPVQPIVTEGKALLYASKAELLQRIDELVRGGVDRQRDYNAYRSYTPDIVMKRFKAVFIDGAIEAAKSRRKEGSNGLQCYNRGKVPPFQHISGDELYIIPK